MKYNQVCQARMRRVLRRCAWVERGSQNEKVVSSVDTSTVTITILHQSPFRFAAATAGYVVAVETASYHEERLYRTPYFHSSSTTGFPLVLLSANLRFSAPGFDTRMTTGSSGRDHKSPHTTIDRSGSSMLDALVSKWNWARLTTVTLLHSPESFSHLKSFFTTERGPPLMFL